MGLRIGVPREIKPGENRVALTPRCVREIVAAGGTVAVEAEAGRESGFADAEYADAGAAIVPDASRAWNADLVVKVKEPLADEFPLLAPETALFTYLHLAVVPDLADALIRKNVTSIAYETVSREGGLPLLRPMSEVAGVLAVQAGARGLEKAAGGRGVLLAEVGGSDPGRVCVIGAGSAGRRAARTAAGIGARVTVLDISPAKVESLRGDPGCGARFLVATPESVAESVCDADLVVSAVLVPGDKAPLLISRTLLRRMKPGAVVVDIAIDQGGTLETSRPTTHAAPYYVEEGIVHYCVTNMPAAVPRTSTQALTGATLPYILAMVRSGVAGALRSDPGLRAGLNTREGHVTCPGVARALGRPAVAPESLL